MAGGFSTPKKDRGVKVGSGQSVKTGTILARGFSTYKAGSNVKGLSTLYALCEGKVYFSKRKTSHGRIRTCINVSCGKKKPNP
jgi:ribosomal protein L27